MGDRVTVRLENRQVDGIEAMTEYGDADNDSEALRTALNIGLAELGYLSGNARQDTRLRAIARRFADAFAIVTGLWFGVTYFLPLKFRVVSFAPVFAMLACLGIDRGLASVEPKVSNRLNAIATTLLGGDNA